MKQTQDREVKVKKDDRQVILKCWSPPPQHRKGSEFHARVVFQVPGHNSNDTKLVSGCQLNSDKFEPKEYVRFHKLRVQSYKTAILRHSSDANCKSRLLPVFLTYWL